MSDSSLNVLTRKQLWLGLVMRARFPEKFNHGLECHTEQIEHNVFMRTIQAGSSRFCERVALTPEQQIRTNSIPNQVQIRSESITTIEEPEAGYLFVRFSYKRELDTRDDRVDVGEHLKAAYVQVDRDAITMIRMLAESTLFDKTIN